MSNRVKAFIALFVVNFIYGANYLIAKGIMPDHFGPSGLVMARVVGAGVLFWIIALKTKEKIQKADFPRLILCGLTGVALNQLLYLNGLNLTSPIDASIIMTAIPVLVIIIASFLLKEKITKNKMIGILFGTAGALTLIYLGSNSATQISSSKGNILILMNATSYSFYLVLVKPLMKKYNHMTVIKWVFFFGFIFSSPISFSQFSEVNWSEIPASAMYGLIYLVFATTFMAYLLNIFALSHISPSISGSFIYFQPVVAIVYALLEGHYSEGVYGNDITVGKLACTALIFVGVYLISKKKKAPVLA